jgi:hypothetical protein
MRTGAATTVPSSALARAAKSAEKRTSRRVCAQHRHRLRVKGLHFVFDGLEVCLKNRDRCADLVREITEQLSAGAFHRSETLRHLVEGPGQVIEVVAQSRQQDTNVVAAVGDCGRRR